MKRINRILLCVLCAFVVQATHAAKPHNGQAKASPARTLPNIVFVLADDLGWRDVGFHGAKFAETPNLDALARDGMIMNQFYSRCYRIPRQSFRRHFPR